MSKTELWVAYSPSDPSPDHLKYKDRESAEKHADTMNELLKYLDGGTRECRGRSFEVNWNKNYWKTKPEPWVFETLEINE